MAFALRSLGFSRLLKKFYSTSCCVELAALPSMGDVSTPERLPRPGPRLPRAAPLLLLSISAGARSIVGIEKDDELKGLKRPAAEGVDESVVVRKIPHKSQSARRAFSMLYFLKKAC